MQEAGIENVLALRGDIPADAEFPLPDQFHYAVELVRYIKQIAPEMCIGGACYPEGHPEAVSKAQDIQHIKEKVFNCLAVVFLRDSNPSLTGLEMIQPK